MSGLAVVTGTPGTLAGVCAAHKGHDVHGPAAPAQAQSSTLALHGSAADDSYLVEMPFLSSPV